MIKSIDVRSQYKRLTLIAKKTDRTMDINTTRLKVLMNDKHVVDLYENYYRLGEDKAFSPTIDVIPGATLINEETIVFTTRVDSISYHTSGGHNRIDSTPIKIGLTKDGETVVCNSKIGAARFLDLSNTNTISKSIGKYIKGYRVSLVE